MPWCILCYVLLLSGASALRRHSPATSRPRGLLKRVGGPRHRFCSDLKRYYKRGIRSEDRPADSVIGGLVVDSPDEFPFLAWIGTAETQHCGGTLISDRVVLTAAHCLFEMDVENRDILVRFGLTDYSSQKGLERRVVNWQAHPSFDNRTIFNDIALLLLDESVPSSTARPVRLSSNTSVESAGAKEEIVGWGSMDESCLLFDTLLRKAKVPLGTSGPMCQLPGTVPLDADLDYDGSRQLCAGGVQQSVSCGDSGGPLLAGKAGDRQQVGIASWTYGLQGGKFYPVVFTRVSFYRAWIETTMEQLKTQGPRCRPTPASGQLNPAVIP